MAKRITDFFPTGSKRPHDASTRSPRSPATPDIDTPGPSSSISVRDVAMNAPLPLSTEHKAVPLSKYDISLAISRPLSNEDLSEFINNTWKPGSDYKFHPIISGNKNPKKRQFNKDWLDDKNLAFSHVDHGLLHSMRPFHVKKDRRKESPSTWPVCQRGLPKFEKVSCRPNFVDVLTTLKSPIVVFLYNTL